MKRTLISMLAVLTLCVTGCILAQITLEKVVAEMENKRMEIVERYESGDKEGARECFVQMAEIWEKRMPVLETMLSHGELHEIKVRIVEARADFETDGADDFIRSMAVLGEVMGHIYEEERLKLSNVL